METRNPIKKPKQSFEEARRHDDEHTFDWLQKVPLDDSLFRCVVCKQNFPCDSMLDLTKHEESALHLTNIEKERKADDSKVDDDAISKSKSFCPRWLEIEQYKPWLREVQHDENSFSCTVCDKIVAGGLPQIERHAEDKKHKKNLEKRDTRMSESSGDTQTEYDRVTSSLWGEMREWATTYNIPLESAQNILGMVQQNPEVFKNLSHLSSPPSSANADASSSDE